MDAELCVRLVSKLSISPKCWEWTGATVSPGSYGQISVKSKLQLAHRVMFKMYYGEIPQGMIVMHSCDNPKMGGNAETITLPCTLVARLIGMAQGYQHINLANLIDILNGMDQELVWADDEARAWLEKNQ